MYFVPFASWLGIGSVPPVSPRSPEDNTKMKKKSPVVDPGKIGSWIVSYDDKGLPYWTNDVSRESTYRLLVQHTDQPGMPLRHVGDSKSPPWALPIHGPPSSSVVEAAAAAAAATASGPPWALPLHGPPSFSSAVSPPPPPSGTATPIIVAKRGRGGNGGRSKAAGGKAKKKGKTGGGGGGGGGGGDDGDDDGIIRMGRWEELFDAVDGKKIWYNALTLKKTTKDPFW